VGIRKAATQQKPPAEAPITAGGVHGYEVLVDFRRFDHFSAMHHVVTNGVIASKRVMASPDLVQHIGSISLTLEDEHGALISRELLYIASEHKRKRPAQTV
jgi:hypothetical protein